ncbi:hypothetical protein FFLO_04712 [Filobasidium floriforme]|uniref:Plasma membrane proteolipid 3 n=1 Tax=Filobasidium floriforme TaxID=5210 RepID=A0A8K0NPM9_9TREE|nr:uncharacterized protein HD553DRAFT_312409 [Filobasidium floriforme]KAG7530934.1 hypothetical protein FFLO_04712 [Filobasidium floriforme]KAH8084258.1 hypothetical protein HD553DRAFT_312409 [Filobasidium floriforme]
MVKSSSGDMLLYVLAILLPPVPVFLKAGCGGQLLINILLCCLAWIPGIIHAWWVIGKHTTPARSARY